MPETKIDLEALKAASENWSLLSDERGQFADQWRALIALARRGQERPEPADDAMLEELERLEKAATPGKWLLWSVLSGRSPTIEVQCKGALEIVHWKGFDNCDRSPEEHEANAALIAAARTALLPLIARVRAAEAREAREEREHMETIAQRDAAQDALTAAYEAVVGESPEWSNLFGYNDAINTMDARVRAAEAKAAEVERSREALLLAWGAMNHMGDILNGMDAVLEEDETACAPAFDAVRALFDDTTLRAALGSRGHE